MNPRANRDTRILAIDPFTRGFGFAVLEGAEGLIDWGVKETKTDKNRRSLKLITELMDRYEPAVVVVEDHKAKGSRRCDRVGKLISEISKLASKKKVKVRSIS